MYKKISNQRKDFHFKLANKICSEYALICIEDLNIKGMQKRWGRKISDYGFSEFIKILEYKAREIGSIVQKIDRYYPSSQICHVCGTKNPETKNFAVNLGIALQLTNILRDIKTDAENGRIYIPMEDLRRFNFTENDLLSGNYNSEFIKLMEFECSRAREFYAEADRDLPKEDKGNMFAARIMEHIYFRLLKKIESKNYNVFEKRLSVSKLKKILITTGVYVKYKTLYGFNEDSLVTDVK